MSDEAPNEERKEESLPELSASPAEWKFRMGGKEYCLRELYGTQRDRYMTASQENLKFDQKGNVVGLRSFDDHQVALIKLGLYEKDDSGTFTKMVPDAIIRSFPASTQKTLYDRLQKMCGLDPKADEATGNS